MGFQHGCVNDKGRFYCGPECGHLTLEREGVTEPIEYIDSLKNKNLGFVFIFFY
ncbi:MAG: hypothetical protein ABIH59_01085 [archaeon]